MDVHRFNHSFVAICIFDYQQISYFSLSQLTTCNEFKTTISHINNAFE